jgi:hypothetical protein
MTPGGQNFTYCCVKAINSFLQNGNSSEIAISSSFSPKSQYPCGATWQGNPVGAPSVKVSYTWCSQQCPGWQLSRSQKLNEWLQPFVGFILPAVIFTLNVPRRRKLSLPDFVFPEDITQNPVTFVVACCCALTAAIIVAIDTVLWLCAVFALAGPLLLSGLYEAWIDKRVLDFVSEKIENEHLELTTRIRILLTVLVGNLDLDFAWAPTMDIARPRDTSPRIIVPTRPPSTSRNAGADPNPEHLLTVHTESNAQARPCTTPINISESSAERVDAISATTSETTVVILQTTEIPNATNATALSLEEIEDVKSQLKSMLACQYSFGSTIGAPVVFYIGSFIYTVSEIRSLLGDNASTYAGSPLFFFGV